jgi:hypothetical protein
MVSSSQIRERLAMFQDNRINLESFEDWFVRNTWNIHQTGSESAASLTFAVEESLFEYSSGHISLEELHSELEALLEAENIIVNVFRVPQRVWPTSLSWKAVISSPTVQARLVRP